MDFHFFIGSDASTILWWQMCIRASLIFLATLIYVRLGHSRIYGKYGSLDIVLSVILGSILSRALTANAPFLPTLAAAWTLIVIHHVLIRLSRRSKTLGHLVKGKEILLIDNGRIIEEALAKAGMTLHDLLIALRMNGNIESPQQVKRAYLERTGEVSVLT